MPYLVLEMARFTFPPRPLREFELRRPYTLIFAGTFEWWDISEYHEKDNDVVLAEEWHLKETLKKCEATYETEIGCYSTELRPVNLLNILEKCHYTPSQKCSGDQILFERCGVDVVLPYRRFQQDLKDKAEVVVADDDTVSKNTRSKTLSASKIVKICHKCDSNTCQYARVCHCSEYYLSMRDYKYCHIPRGARHYQ